MLLSNFKFVHFLNREGKMKKLRYMRHSLKNGEVISMEGHEFAEKHTPPGDYTDLFHSQFLRTLQTLRVIIHALGCEAIIHSPIEQTGTSSLFRLMATPKFQEV